MSDADTINQWNTLARSVKDLPLGLKLAAGNEYILLMRGQHTVQCFRSITECRAFVDGIRRGPEIAEWIKEGAK